MAVDEHGTVICNECGMSIQELVDSLAEQAGIDNLGTHKGSK